LIYKRLFIVHLIWPGEFIAYNDEQKSEEKMSREENKITISRFENGKIVEVWGAFDRLGMLQQLGLMP
jgi:hypothetical protein